MINRMGMEAAKEKSRLNELTRSQLEWVYDHIAYYIGKGGREQMPADTKDLMPHEWGSLDTYDDMLNSMNLAGIMLGALLEMEATDKATDEGLRAWLRGVMLEEVGVCAHSEKVGEFVENGNPDWYIERG